MKIKFSINNATHKRPAYNFKPMSVSSLEDLAKIMQNNAVCSQIFGEDPLPNNEGKNPKPYRKQIINIVHHGNVIFLDIDHGNPSTKKVKKVCKKLQSNFVIMPSSSSTKKKRKYHIAIVVKNDVGDHVSFKQKYNGLIGFFARHGIELDRALKNSTQLCGAYKAGYGDIVIKKGARLPFDAFSKIKYTAPKGKAAAREGDWRKEELSNDTLLTCTDGDDIFFREVSFFNSDLTRGRHYNCPFDPEVHSDKKGEGRAGVKNGTLFCKCGKFATPKFLEKTTLSKNVQKIINNV